MFGSSFAAELVPVIMLSVLWLQKHRCREPSAAIVLIAGLTHSTDFPLISSCKVIEVERNTNEFLGRAARLLVY